MITEKLNIALRILKVNPATRGDGNGEFLNAVSKEVNFDGDFKNFAVESWTRAKRKMLEKHPELDMRTYKTRNAQYQVASEMI